LTGTAEVIWEGEKLMLLSVLERFIRFIFVKGIGLKKVYRYAGLTLITLLSLIALAHGRKLRDELQHGVSDARSQIFG
jgi:hypothetical protein